MNVDGGESGSDRIVIGDGVKGIDIRNFDDSDILDLSTYNADKLAAYKHNDYTAIHVQDNYTDSIVKLSGVTESQSNNIIYKDENGATVAVSLDWIVEQTPILDVPKPVPDFPKDETLPTDPPDDDNNGGGDDTQPSVTVDENGNITGTEGNDTINNENSNVTINALGGNDTVYNHKSYVLLNGNEGNDDIRNWSDGDNVTIIGGDGDDYISNDGDNVTIEGGEGNDVIENEEYADNVVINGGIGNDHIYNRGSHATINGDDDNDTITCGYVMEGDGDYSEINGGNGNDSIIIYGTNNSTYYGNAGNDEILIHSLYFELVGHDLVVDSGEGNDTITFKKGNDIFVECGDGDDIVIYNQEESGNNTRTETFQNITSGRDITFFTSDALATVKCGSGNDTLFLGGASVYCNVGEGKDYIKLSDRFFWATLSGLTSRDTIDFGGQSDDIIVAGISGENIIFAGDDVSDHGSMEWGLTLEGIKNFDAIVNLPVIKGELTATLGELFNISTVAPTLPAPTPIDDTPTIPSTPTEPLDKNQNNTYKYNGGNKIITDYSSEEKLQMFDNLADVNVSGNNLTLNTNKGALTLENASDKLVDITDSDGNTTAQVYMARAEGGEVAGNALGNSPDIFKVIVGASETKNQLIASDSGSSLFGGKTDDVLQGSSGQDYFSYESGNDTITNYETWEDITFSGTYQNWTTDGNDLVINSAEGSLRITDAKDKLVELKDADGNILAHICMPSGEENFDGNTYNEYVVAVGADNENNQLIAGSAGSSLWGGSGKNSDTLYGGAGADTFIYNYGNGNDAIFNADYQDTVMLNDITFEQIIGAKLIPNRATFMFTDYGSLNISGEAGNFIIDGQAYNADYQNNQFHEK